MRLTRNFAVSEFDVNEPWPPDKGVNRRQLAELLQWLRDLAKSPGVVTSAYRSPQRNAEVGGTETSQHMKGEAADVVFNFVGLRTLGQRVLDDIAAGKAPRFGQIIFYHDRGHVHVSLPTLGSRNGEVRHSYIGENGTRYYPLLASAADLPLVSDRQRSAGFVFGGGAALLLVLLVVPLLVPSSRV